MSRAVVVPCPLQPLDKHALHEKGWCCGSWNPKRQKHCMIRAGCRTQHLGFGNCSWHFGNASAHVISAQRQMARQACDRLGLEREGDPGDILLHAVWEAAGNVEFYRSLVGQLATHPDDDEFVLDETGKGGHWVRGETGVYGRTYHASGIPTGEAKPHVLVQLYNEERDRLVKHASEALKAGVEERRVRLAEADATSVISADAKALEEMGLGDRIGEFHALFLRYLRGEPPALGIGEGA